MCLAPFYTTQSRAYVETGIFTDMNILVHIDTDINTAVMAGNPYVKLKIMQIDFFKMFSFYLKILIYFQVTSENTNNQNLFSNLYTCVSVDLDLQ